MANYKNAERILGNLIQKSEKLIDQPGADSNIYTMWESYFPELARAGVSAIVLAINYEPYAVLYFSLDETTDSQQTIFQFEPQRTFGSSTLNLSQKRKAKYKELSELQPSRQDLEPLVLFIHALVTYFDNKPQIQPIYGNGSSLID